MGHEEVILTPYGYGTIKEKNSQRARIKMTWGGEAYIQFSDLTNAIAIRVKCFVGRRKSFEYSWNIDNTFEMLYEQLAKSLGVDSISSLKLFYPMGHLREVKVTDTPYSLRLKAVTKFVMVIKNYFQWDSLVLTKNIELSNNNRTATKKAETGYECILGNSTISSGRHYWEVKLDNFPNDEDIYIGIAIKEINLYSSPPDSGMFWGYICSVGKKCGPGFVEDYSASARTGDVIGVLLEFKGENGILSFLKNGVELGPAFVNLTGTFYPAVFLFHQSARVTLSCKY